VTNLAEHYYIYSETKKTKRRRKRKKKKRRRKKRSRDEYAHTMSHNISGLWNGNSEPKR